MNTNSSTMRLSAVMPAVMQPPRARTGIFKRNARKVEREMLVRTELAFRLRDRIPLVMSLLTVFRMVSRLITGL